MSRTSRYQELLSEGLSRDNALGVLRQEGASPIDCIKAMVESEGLGLGDAKRLFHDSPSWADKNSEFDAFHEEMAELAARVGSENI